MVPASLAIPLLVLAALPAPPPASAATPAPAAAEAKGLPTPTEEAWGDEWFDDAAAGAAALERQRILAAEEAELARRREAEAARAAAGAATPAPPPAPEARPIAPPVATFADLDVAWRERREALLRQDREAAGRAEERLLALRAELDAGELHALAGAAIRESRGLEPVSAGDATARAELAVALGPSLPAAHLQLARVRFRAAPTELGAWLRPAAAGLRIAAAEPRWRRPILADVGGAALAGVLAAGAIVLALVAIRRGRHVLHDFHHLFPRAATPVQSSALALLLLAAPAVLGAGPLGTAAILAAALWMHLLRPERLVVGAFLASLAVAPFAAGALGGLVAWSAADEGVWSLERAGDFGALPALERRAAREDATPELLFAVARAKKRAGDLDGAGALYARALEARPSWAAALVNQGNVRFLQGRGDEALALYGRAIAARPTLAAAYFDLSRLHYRRLDFAPGDEARNRALALDRTLVDRYAAGERDAAPKANLFLLDVPLDDPGASPAEEDRALLVAEATRLVAGRLPPRAVPWAVAVLLAALAGLAALAARLHLSRPCPKCGRTACRRCDPEVGEGGLCAQCVHVYARREPVEHGARLQKELAVQRYAARKRRAQRALSFVLASHVVSGRVVRGALLLAVAATLAALLLAPQGPIRLPPFGPPVFLRLAIAAPLLALVWALGVRDALGRED